MAKRGRKIIDETGNRYGRLVVIGRGQNNAQGGLQWHCKCDCGNETLNQGAILRKGGKISCGCYALEKLRSQIPSEKFIAEGRAALVAFNHSRALDPKERKDREKIWRKRSQEKRIDKRRVEERERDKKQSECLSDRYVARLLYKKTGVARKSIPSDLIETQRKIILINRFLKENDK